MDAKHVKWIANNNGWRVVAGKKSQKIEFKRMAWTIIVNCTKNTATTILRHPRYGWTKLVRANVDEKLLTHIFHYPRVHTDKAVSIEKIKH
jgi:hypothetical protein